MKRFAPLLVIPLLLAVFGFWWYSPKQVIKRRTEAMLQTLTLAPDKGTAARQIGVYSFNSLLAEDVELSSESIPEANGLLPRSEMEAAYSWLCEHAKQTSFTLVKFDSIQTDETSADVKFTLKALVELPSNRPVDGTYQATYHWQKTESGWLLSRADWKEVKP